MIDFKCPECGEEMCVPSSLSGKAEVCPTCNTRVVVPNIECDEPSGKPKLTCTPKMTVAASEEMSVVKLKHAALVKAQRALAKAESKGEITLIREARRARAKARAAVNRVEGSLDTECQDIVSLSARYAKASLFTNNKEEAAKLKAQLKALMRKKYFPRE